MSQKNVCSYFADFVQYKYKKIADPEIFSSKNRADPEIWKLIKCVFPEFL